MGILLATARVGATDPTRPQTLAPAQTSVPTSCLENGTARPLLGPTPDMAREIPYPPALPPVSREGGNVFLEDSSEPSRIDSFTGVRVPQGTNHICKGYQGGSGEGN